MAKAKDELTAEQLARLNEPGLHRVSCRLYLSIARSGFREWCYRYRWDGQARTTLEKLAKAASSAKDLSKGGRRRETGKHYGVDTALSFFVRFSSHTPSGNPTGAFATFALRQISSSFVLDERACSSLSPRT